MKQIFCSLKILKWISFVAASGTLLRLSDPSKWSQSGKSLKGEISYDRNEFQKQYDIRLSLLGTMSHSLHVISLMHYISNSSDIYNSQILFCLCKYCSSFYMLKTDSKLTLSSTNTFKS